MELRKHQEELLSRCIDVLREHKLCYLSAEERVGKTLPAIMAAYHLSEGGAVLILTKKKALDGWCETINSLKINPTRFCFIINYERVKNLLPSYENSFSFVILDEAHHALSAYPKPSKTAQLVQKLIYKSPYVLFLSATPHAESYSQIFHQLNVSQHSPFDGYRDFYKWFAEFGRPQFKWVGPRQIAMYNEINSELLLPEIKHLFVTMTREQAGFEEDPEDSLHYVEPSEFLKSKYAEAERLRIIRLEDERVLELDTPSRLLFSLHQMEGGTIKVSETESLELGNTEKIDYIKKMWGDKEDTVIFYNYIAEGKLLRKSFQNTLILQGTSFAEGVDLSNYAHLVIFSQNFSASKYIQRRARQCNFNRKDPIKVHFLLMKNWVSDQCYDCVSSKYKNFTFKLYKPSNV